MKRAITYSKGALFLARLREVMGERAFWTALRRYTRRYAGKSAATRDFERVFAAESVVELSRTFAEWAYGEREASPGMPAPARPTADGGEDREVNSSERPGRSSR